MADAYGVAGWVKVAPYNDPQDSILRSCRRWWFAGGGPVAVERARVHAGSVVCKVAGVDDRDAALALRGREILVARADFPAARADEFYCVDLVGCEVLASDGRHCGTVLEVDDHGAHALLRVSREDGGSELVPFVAQWVVSVDMAARRVVTDWPFDD